MTMSYESKLKKDIIPANYFCKYHIDLDSKIKWQLKVYRYISVLFMEKLEVVLTSISAPFGTSRGNRNSVMFDDEWEFGSLLIVDVILMFDRSFSY